MNGFLRDIDLIQSMDVDADDTSKKFKHLEKKEIALKDFKKKIVTDVEVYIKAIR